MMPQNLGSMVLGRISRSVISSFHGAHETRLTSLIQIIWININVPPVVQPWLHKPTGRLDGKFQIIGVCLSESKGNSFYHSFIARQYHRRLPRLLGKPIKLSDLFVAVVSRGGYKRVCDHRCWLEVAREIKLPSECANASVGLRRIYYQFLSHFEFKEYPSLSEQFLVQTLVEPDVTPEDVTLPLSSVERNLGIGTSCNHAHMTSVQSAVDLFDQSHRSRLFPLFQASSFCLICQFSTFGFIC